jgi:putative sugar O-methyltransferase
MGERTSISDDDVYPAFCAAAAAEDALFAGFKRDPRYRAVLEHVTPEQGLAYAEVIARNYPFLAEDLDRFRANDAKGAPLTHDFGAPLGAWSPTTLRYVKVAGDLITMFGALDGFDIVEIGAGYGGQCYVLSQLAGWRSYTIFDLAPVQKLQQRYLAELGVDNVAFASLGSLKRGARYDLAISNYAFSECARQVQDQYLARVLGPSDRGYLTCNNLADACYSGPELRERIPNVIGLPEIPLSSPDNYLLAWNRVP